MTDEARLARIEERLHENARNLAVLEATFQSADRSNARALQLQADEYDRRLQILNGEAAKLVSMQVTYLPREVFDRIVCAIQKDILDLNRHRDRMIGQVSVIAFVISLLITLLMSLLISRIS